MSKIPWLIIFSVIMAWFLIKILLEISMVMNNDKTIQNNYLKLFKRSEVSNEHAVLQKPGKFQRSSHPGDDDKQRKFKILLWTGWFKHNYIKYVSRTGECPYSNCEYTDNRKDLKSFDALIFNWMDIRSEDVPQEVFDHQRWVLVTMESPHHIRTQFNNLGLKKVDWIMSYRSESEIFTPYGNVVKCKPSWKPRYKFENKSKSIAWFVSNCKTPSNRETYAKNLGQYIDIDIYGGCGTFRCPLKSDSSCKDNIAAKYKFYLSFENSICTEYVTEKSFHYMEYDIIPVVLGGANYSAIFPPNSYIDVLNFTSPRDLAQYLWKVGTDKSLYNSYFEWKKSYCVQRVDHITNLCKLCKQLNQRFDETNKDKEEERVKLWSKEDNCQTIKFENESIILTKI